MFRALFMATLIITLVVNIIFLLTTKEKPPDDNARGSPPFQPTAATGQRRLFLRSNDFYDYSAAITMQNLASSSLEPPLPVTQNYEGFERKVLPIRPPNRTTLMNATDKRDISTNSTKMLLSGWSKPVNRTNNQIGRDSGAAAMKNFVPIDRDVRKEEMVIRVKSSRDHVFVSVDNNVIYESKSANYYSIMPPLVAYPIARPANGVVPAEQVADEVADEGRGIHVIVLNERDASVMARRVFDTYLPQQDDELCHFISMVRDGRLLIFAVKDEASFRMPLNSAARDLLQKLGSRHIMNLRWRDMWAFVARKSTLAESDLRPGESSANYRKARAKLMNLAEGLSKSSRFSNWAPAVMLELSVRLVSNSHDNSIGDSPTKPAQEECHWNSGNLDEDKRRAEFCSRVEGYGRVCDCDFAAPISFRPKKLAHSRLEQVPIVVMAGNRPYYLYRMLRSLLSTTGVNQSMVTVFIDGFYQEPLMVSRLFNLRAVQQRPRARRSARISHHYKSSLTATFQLFPRAEYAIIFEEDLDIAQDALVYFNQTLAVLERDPSLYCASAWNDQGYEHTARDSKLIYRVETMPGLGWMLSRKLYKDELEMNWPAAEQPHDWDMWIRTSAVRKQRECLIPDVSRTFHFGATGTNINSYFQRQYFSKHAFNLEPQSEFADLDQLTSERYELMIEQLVRNGRVLDGAELAKPLNATEYLCSLADNNNNNRPFSQQQGVNVIYIDMIDKQDFSNWLSLARCWRIWDLDARGQHNSMWRLFLSGQHTLVIGSPASPYSRLKPHNLAPFKLATQD